MPNKSDPMAASGTSNKEVGEFTKQYVSRHNAVPTPNARKSIGQDRGTSVNHDLQGEGDGEYDRVLKPKMENN